MWRGSVCLCVVLWYPIQFQMKTVYSEKKVCGEKGNESSAESRPHVNFYIVCCAYFSRPVMLISCSLLSIRILIYLTHALYAASQFSLGLKQADLTNWSQQDRLRHSPPLTRLPEPITTSPDNYCDCTRSSAVYLRSVPEVALCPAPLKICARSFLVQNQSAKSRSKEAGSQTH